MQEQNNLMPEKDLQDQINTEFKGFGTNRLVDPHYIQRINYKLNTSLFKNNKAPEPDAIKSVKNWLKLISQGNTDVENKLPIEPPQKKCSHFFYDPYKKFFKNLLALLTKYKAKYIDDFLNNRQMQKVEEDLIMFSPSTNGSIYNLCKSACDSFKQLQNSNRIFRQKNRATVTFNFFNNILNEKKKPDDFKRKDYEQILYFLTNESNKITGSNKLAGKLIQEDGTELEYLNNKQYNKRFFSFLSDNYKKTILSLLKSCEKSYNKYNSHLYERISSGRFLAFKKNHDESEEKLYEKNDEKNFRIDKKPDNINETLIELSTLQKTKQNELNNNLTLTIKEKSEIRDEILNIKKNLIMLIKLNDDTLFDIDELGLDLSNLLKKHKKPTVYNPPFLDFNKYMKNKEIENKKNIENITKDGHLDDITVKSMYPNDLGNIRRFILLNPWDSLQNSLLNLSVSTGLNVSNAPKYFDDSGQLNLLQIDYERFLLERNYHHNTSEHNKLFYNCIDISALNRELIKKRLIFELLQPRDIANIIGDDLPIITSYKDLHHITYIQTFNPIPLIKQVDDKWGDRNGKKTLSYAREYLKTYNENASELCAILEEIKTTYLIPKFDGSTLGNLIENHSLFLGAMKHGTKEGKSATTAYKRFRKEMLQETGNLCLQNKGEQASEITKKEQNHNYLNHEEFFKVHKEFVEHQKDNETK